jgi:hypothetical protein
VATQPATMEDGDPDERMGRRLSRWGAWRWVLLDGHRFTVAGLVLAGLFVSLLAVGLADPVGLGEPAGNGDPVETLFQALLSATVTGVTLVVTINQLVLSQELGALGDQRERMAGAMAFRRDVEDVIAEDVAPATPAGFLRALVEAVRTHAAALDDAVAAGAPAREAVEDYVADLDRTAAGVSEALDGAEFGTFEVVHAALDLDYSRQLHRARELRAGDAGAPDDEAQEALTALVEVLELYGPAREHLKTLYFQSALIELSRVVLYAALPALSVAAAMVLYVDVPAGSTLGVAVVAAAATVTLAPFALLLSYVLQVVTVAKRTLAIGPFLLRETG